MRPARKNRQSGTRQLGSTPIGSAELTFVVINITGAVLSPLPQGK